MGGNLVDKLSELNENVFELIGKKMDAYNRG